MGQTNANYKRSLGMNDCEKKKREEGRVGGLKDSYFLLHEIRSSQRDQNITFNTIHTGYHWPDDVDYR